MTTIKIPHSNTNKIEKNSIPSIDEFKSMLDVIVGIFAPEIEGSIVINKNNMTITIENNGDRLMRSVYELFDEYIGDEVVDTFLNVKNITKKVYKKYKDFFLLLMIGYMIEIDETTIGTNTEMFDYVGYLEEFDTSKMSDYELTSFDVVITPLVINQYDYCYTLFLKLKELVPEIDIKIFAITKKYTENIFIRECNVSFYQPKTSNVLWDIDKKYKEDGYSEEGLDYFSDSQKTFGRIMEMGRGYTEFMFPEDKTGCDNSLNSEEMMGSVMVKKIAEGYNSISNNGTYQISLSRMLNENTYYNKQAIMPEEDVNSRSTKFKEDYWIFDKIFKGVGSDSISSMSEIAIAKVDLDPNNIKLQEFIKDYVSYIYSLAKNIYNSEEQFPYKILDKYAIKELSEFEIVNTSNDMPITTLVNTDGEMYIELAETKNLVDTAAMVYEIMDSKIIHFFLNGKKYQIKFDDVNIVDEIHYKELKNSFSLILYVLKDSISLVLV